MKLSRRSFLFSSFSIFFLTSCGKFKNLFLKSSTDSQDKNVSQYFNGYFEKIFFSEKESINYFFSTNNMNIHKVKKVRILDVLSEVPVYEEIVDIPMDPSDAKCSSYKEHGCKYSSSFQLKAGKLPSGYYKIILEAENKNLSSPSFFGIRPDVINILPKTIAVVFPEFTWQAYNESGGGSLYTPNPSNLYRVSLMRPVQYDGHHGPSGTLVFVRKLRALGYDILPLSSRDIHSNPRLFENVKTILFTTHDEYWSQEMRTHIEAFIERGGHAAIFAGNFCWWKVNVKLPEILVDKEDREKKPDAEYISTGHWHSLAVKYPETKTFGLSYKHAGYPIAAKIPKSKQQEYKISDKDYERSNGMFVLDYKHDIFKGLHLKNGDSFGSKSNLIFVEIDGVPIDVNGNLKPTQEIQTPSKMKLLASAQVYNAHFPTNPLVHVATIADITFGKGRIMHMGSIGWYKTLEKEDPTCLKIFENTISMLMA